LKILADNCLFSSQSFARETFMYSLQRAATALPITSTMRKLADWNG